MTIGHIVGFIIGFSVTSNLFLYLEVRRLKRRLDTLYDFVANEQLEEEEVVTWQSTN